MAISSLFNRAKRSRRKQKSRRAAHVPYLRRLFTESLESRRLLAINVAIVQDTSSGDAAGFIATRNQLNDDTYFDFNATLVNSSQVDTLAELSAYDVVVVGNNGSGGPDAFSNLTFTAALRNWVEDHGGGVVMTGWGVFGAGAATPPTNSDIDAIIPVNSSGGYNYFSAPANIGLVGSHPITVGLGSNLQITSSGGPNLVEFPASSPQLDGGATLLGQINGHPVIAAAAKGAGRGVYLGPIYAGASSFDNSSLRSGPADRLLEQAVAWASESPPVAPPMPAINVAIVQDISSLDTAGFVAIRNQLNDDTYFDFNATLVNSSQVDTLAKLNAYDVIVVGNNGYGGTDAFSNLTFTAALRSWVENHGGGVVMTGWGVYGAGASSPPANTDVDAIIPVNTSGIMSFYSAPININIVGSHPITNGLGSVLQIAASGGSNYVEFPASSPQLDTGAALLGQIGGAPVIVAAQKGAGRGVYLGPIYSGYSGYGTSALRTGAADRLLEQAVHWAASDAPPRVIHTIPEDGSNVAEGIDTFTIEFNRALTTATAEDLANYQLSGPNGIIAIQTAILSQSGTSVTLHFAAQTAVGEYGLFVNGLSDLEGNTISSGGYLAAQIRITQSPLASVVGDFNGDGLIDLIVHQNNSRNLMFFKGLANGDLDSGTSLPNVTSGAYVKEMTAADLNKDGKLDLVIAEYGPGAGVYFGNGNGTFAAGQFGVSQASYSVAIGDVNNDGWLDVVVGSYQSSAVVVYLNNQSSNFSSWPRQFSSGPSIADHHLADVNDDGKLDIISNSYYTTGYVWLGNGAGGFQIAYSFNHGSSSEHTALADIDGDGLLDLATGPYGSQIAYGTSGAPYFGANQNLNAGGNNATNISAVDLDGDGDLDLIKGGWGGDGQLYISYNNGNRTFTNEAIDLRPSGIQYIWVLQTPDMNGDGLPEIIGTDYTQNRVFLLKSKNGLLAATFEILPSPPLVVSTTPADGDAAYSSLESITVEFNEPVTAATAEDTQNYRLIGPNGEVSITSAVLASDQTTVSLTFATQNTVGVYRLHVGNVTDLAGAAMPPLDDGFAAAQIRITPSPLASVVGDFNGDGLIDLIVHQNNSRNLMFFKGLANGDLDGGTSLPNVTSATFVKEMTAADLNKDGKLDLVIAEYGPGASVYFGNGNGTFATGQFGVSQATYSVAIGDVNNDGWLDIVAGDYQSSAVVTYINNQSSNFPSWPRQLSSGPTIADHHLADINDDGNLDIVSNGFSTTGYVWFGNGAGGFQVASSFNHGSSGEHTALADIDGDGLLDLATGPYGSQITYGTSGVPYFGANQNLNAGANYATNMSAVDVDGDGDLDLIKGGWGGDGQLYISYNNGNRTFTNDVIDLRPSGIQYIWVLQTPDMNGDGLPEIIGTDYTQNRVFLLKSQNGLLAATFEILPSPPPVADSQVVDGVEDENVLVQLASAVSLTARITTLPSNGRLFQTDDGTALGAEITVSGTPVTDLNLRVIFVPEMNLHGPSYAEFGFTLNDGINDSNEALVTVNIEPVNDAPVLVSSTDFVSITEDDIDNAGQQLGSIYTFTDVDGDASAIAIIGSDSGNGSWQYRTASDPSGLWRELGVVSPTSALLIRDIDRMRFVPNGENGTTASITYRAWDKTVSAPGQRFDASTGGGITAFSAEIATSMIVVTDVNDAPVLNLDPTGITFAEGGTFSRAGTITDLDVNDVLTATVNYGDGTGGQPLSVDSGDFQLEHMYADDGEFQVRVVVTDSQGASVSETVLVSVTNIAPTLNISGSATVNEGSTYALNLAASDPGEDTISEWRIDWGDGSPAQQVTGNASSVTHVYADGTRNYTILATATDEDGTWSALAAGSNAQASLDPSFGTAGEVVQNLDGFTGDYVRALTLVQPDGKVLVAGYTQGGTYRIALARYDIGGSLDTTFGSDGTVVTEFGQYAIAESILLDGNGNILVAGNFGIARYSPDGVLDTAFGNGGRLTGFSNIRKAILDANGNILVGNGYQFARFQPGGAFDLTFGSHGITPYLGYSYNDFTLAPDGKIVTIENRYNGNVTNQFDVIVRRHLANGQGLDSGFGQSGQYVFDSGLSDSATQVAIQQGKILVGGIAEQYEFNAQNQIQLLNRSVLLFRIADDGQGPDAHFGTSGVVTFRYNAANGNNYDYYSGMGVDPSGRIVVTGSYGLYRFSPAGQHDTTFGGALGYATRHINTTTNTSPIVFGPGLTIYLGGIRYNGIEGQNFAIQRFLDTGVADSTFDNTPNDGSAYYVQTGFTGPLADYLRHVTVRQADGKVLVVGYTSGGTAELLLARYLPNGELDTEFGTPRAGDPAGIIRTGINNSANAAAVAADGTIYVTNGSTIYKFLSNGSLDTTTTANGFWGGQRYAEGVSVQSLKIDSTGRLLAGGYRWQLTNGTYSYDAAVARLSSNGVPDSTFGIGGVASFDQNTTATVRGDQFIYAIDVDVAGQVVAVGYSRDYTAATNQYGNNSAVIARFTPNGQLDPTFNPSGGGVLRTTGAEGATSSQKVAIDAEGKILVGFSSALHRYNQDGSLDMSFNNTGTTLSSYSIQALTLDAFGRIVTAGSGYLGRLKSDGTSDTTFGPGGRIGTSNRNSFVVTVDDANRILAAGSTSSTGSTGTDYWLARYTTDGLAVTVNNVSPTITSITGPTSATEGSSVTLTASATDPAGDNDPLTYAWTVYRNNAVYLQASGASITFDVPDNGTYRADLLVADGDGGSAAISRTISVANVAPTATFESPASVDEGSPIVLSLANPADVSSVDAAAGFQYAFDFGGGFGAYSTNNAASFTPGDNGIRFVKGLIRDKDGGVSEYQASVTVQNVNPEATITGVPETNVEGTEIILGSNVSDAGTLDTHSYEWSLTKDGLAYAGTGNNGSFSFTPNDNGLYVVTLTVTDDDGGAVTTSASLTVANANPTTAIVGAPETSLEGSTISLASAVADPGEVDTHSFTWTVTKDGLPFGNPFSGSTFDFLPNDNGTYVVTLTATDDDGGAGVDEVTVIVNNVSPEYEAGVDATLLPAVQGQLVRSGIEFTDPGADVWTGTVNYGDGTGDQPLVVDQVNKTFDLNHVYSIEGTFTVTVSLQDDDGNPVEDSFEVTVILNQAPTIAVDHANLAFDEGTLAANTGTFADQQGNGTVILSASVGTIIKDDATGTWSWSTPALDGPNGPTTVTITATDNFGESAQAIFSFTVDNVAPTAQIASISAVRVEGTEIVAVGTATDPAGANDVLTFAWSVYKNGAATPFFSQSAVDLTEFSFTPDDNGEYRLVLAVADEDGGSTSVEQTIQIANVAPTALGLSLSAAAIDEDGTTTLSGSFHDPSTLDTHTVTIDWGDGSASNVLSLPAGVLTFTSPTHRYLDNGTYTLSVRVTDNDGGVVATAGAEGFLDQDFLTNVSANSTTAIRFDLSSAQTFTVGAGGQLTGVRAGVFRNTAYTGTTPDLYVEIRPTTSDGAVNADPSSALARVTLTPSEVGTSRQLLLDLRAFGITVSPGQVLAIVYRVAGPHDPGSPYGFSGDFFQGPTYDPYSGGRHYFIDNTGNVWSPYPGDAIFQTFVGGAGTPSPVVTVANVNPTLGVDTTAVVLDEGQATSKAITTADVLADTVSVSASLGTITDLGNGNWTWSYNGTDDLPVATVTITATDEDGGLTSATFDLTVNNVDPTAKDDIQLLSEDGPAVRIDVLANDTDPAGTADPLSISGVSLVGTKGTVTYDATGVIYDPNGKFESLAAGETATDSFSYSISDGDGGSATGIITVTVVGRNDAPVVDSSVTSTTNEDAVGYSVSLLAGASDPDTSDVLNISGLTLESGDASGITMAGNGLTIDPSAYNYLAVGESAVIKYSYTVEDGHGGAVLQTATITVEGRNDAPTVAAAITNTTNEDAVSYGVNLLAGASDPDTSDVLNVNNLLLVSGDASGINASGDSLTVDPAAYNYLAVGESAVIAYSYTVEDGHGGAVLQTATITIEGRNDAPTVAAAITSTTDEDAVGYIVNLLAGASDPDTSDVLNISGLTLESGDASGIRVAGNSLSVNPGAYNYLAVGESAVITYSYTIVDGHGGSVAQAATITIEGRNDAPTVAAAITSTTNEDAVGYSVSLLAGASDPDTSDVLNISGLTLESGDASGITMAGNGLTIDPSAYNYLAVGESAVIKYSYTVEDGHGGAVLQTATITIEGRNDGPSAVDLNFSAPEDGFVTGNLLAGASDPDATDELTVVMLTTTSGANVGVGESVTTAHGKLTLHADGTFTYIPGIGCECGSESFTYTVSDSQGNTATANVNITIDQHVGVSAVAGILSVGGTNSADVVYVSGANLIVNGVAHSLAGITEVRIWGRGGNDVIDLTGLNISTMIHGGAGNDTITGGSASDVIFGGLGDDTITGAAGHDFLIGGDGRDRIVGSAGNDILVADELECFRDLDFFRAVSLDWALSQNLDSESVDDMIDEYFSDGDVDKLTGSSGADLFIIGSEDSITDYQFGKPKTNKDGDVVIREGVVVS
jgi:uncharacterized delta-60 repeat protein